MGDYSVDRIGERAHRTETRMPSREGLGADAERFEDPNPMYGLEVQLLTSETLDNLRHNRRGAVRDRSVLRTLQQSSHEEYPDSRVPGGRCYGALTCPCEARSPSPEAYTSDVGRLESHDASSFVDGDEGRDLRIGPRLVKEGPSEKVGERRLCAGGTHLEHLSEERRHRGQVGTLEGPDGGHGRPSRARIWRVVSVLDE
jgi:hypothetical protein